MEEQLNEYREAQRRRFEQKDEMPVDSQGSYSPNDPAPMDIDESPAPSAPPESPKLTRRVIPPSPTPEQSEPLDLHHPFNLQTQRQLEADEELARRLQQQEASAPETHEIPEHFPSYPQLNNSQIMEDEELARRLQQAPSPSPQQTEHHQYDQNQEQQHHQQQQQPQREAEQPATAPAQQQEEGGGFFATIGRGLRSAYNLYQQYASDQQLSQDEALARRLQAEENGELPRAMFQVQSPNAGRRANYPHFYNYEEDFEDEQAPTSMLHPLHQHRPRPHPEDPLSRLREANSIFRSMGASPDHPLLQHLQEMMQQTQHAGGGGGIGGGPSGPRIFFFPNQLPAHRYRYPRTMFEVNGIESLPPELFNMVQGESDTSYESLLQLAERLQPVSRGASNEQIEQLPTREFTEGSMPADQAQCGVCLSDYEKGEQLRTLPGCLHSFHKDCIDKWLQINKVCPVCRHEITDTEETTTSS